MLYTVETWEEILENFQNFNSSIETENTIVSERLSQFYHWYYLPELDYFAPSKFLGHKNMTIFSYQGEGSGVNTQRALEPFFHKVEKKSKEFNELYSKLSVFLSKMDKNISKKTADGTGGIYIPKINSKQLATEQSILNQVTKDLFSGNDEYNHDFIEGQKKERYVNYYERNPILRTKAIEIHGYICKVCGFNFEEKYGQKGKNYIEVHHIIPISQLENEKLINPRTDLTVVCSNCHRMLHRDKDNVPSIDELKKMISK